MPVSSVNPRPRQGDHRPAPSADGTSCDWFRGFVLNQVLPGPGLALLSSLAPRVWTLCSCLLAHCAERRVCECVFCACCFWVLSFLFTAILGTLARLGTVASPSRYRRFIHFLGFALWHHATVSFLYSFLHILFLRKRDSAYTCERCHDERGNRFCRPVWWEMINWTH